MDRARLPVGQALMWGLLAACLAALFAAATFRHVADSSDVWDYSQEARQIHRGEGFTSLYTYPVQLNGGGPAFPVRWRMPGWAAVGSVLLSLGIPLPAGWFLLGVLFQAILVALVFLLGAQLHSPRAGAIAAACAVACPLLLDPYSPALSQVPTTALSAGVWLLLLRGRGATSAILAAGLAAAAWYVRAEALLMAPAWLWVASRPKSAGAPNVRRSVSFALAYAALCVPWLFALRAMAGSAAPIHGSPTLLYTPEFPGHFSTRAYETALPGLVEYALRYPASFAFRFAKDVAGFAVDLLAALGPLAVGFAAAGLLLREPRERWRSLAPALPLLVAAALQVAAFACLERSPRFLVPVVPLACVVIGIAASPILDRLCGRTMVAALFAMIVAERGVSVAFQARDAARRSTPLSAAVARELAASAEGFPPTALVLTDTPDWVAWHLDRPALLLPLWRQMDAVAAKHPVAGIFLSSGALARNVADREPEWARIIERCEPIPGYSGPRFLLDGARLYVRTVPPASHPPPAASAAPLSTPTK